MAAPICDDEDYFSQPNKYKFNDIMGTISTKNGISIRAFQKQRLRPGYWVDTRRFVSKGNRELANGLFEIFGDFSIESAGTVRDNLMGWIYDNFRDVERWTHLMLKDRDITLSGWIEKMCEDTTPGDDICLYLLARMYNKHVYVHNKLFYWCTAIHKIKNEVDLELINDCEIELVFVHPWVFGEVKKVRRPKGTLPLANTTSPKRAKKDTGITENINMDEVRETMDCTVTSKKGLQPDNLPKQSVEETRQTRCTVRKRTVTDYSKLIDYDGNDEIGVNFQPSPKKRKKQPINLLRKPSRTRQRIERNRLKNKTKKSSKVIEETRDSQSSINSPMGMSPPMSDSISPNAQSIVPPSTVTTKTEKQKKLKNKTSELRDLANQACTSKGTSSRKRLDQQDTVLVPATNDETKITIDALLSLGNDLNFGTEVIPTDNDLLQPIAPVNTLLDPTPMVSEINSEDTEILDETVALHKDPTPTESETNSDDTVILDETVALHTDNTPVPNAKETGDKQGKRKGKLVVHSFQLARNYKPKCKFSCVGCPQKFATNRELNDHFRSSHPP